MLTLGSPHPMTRDGLVAVATDDVIVVSTSKESGAELLGRLDDSLAAHRIARKTAKDVTLAAELTALGCVLSEVIGWVESDLGKSTR